MRLGTVYIEVEPAQMGPLVAFYRDVLGLGVASEEPGESVWLDAGGTTLGFHVAHEPVSTDSGLVNLAFEVADVDAETARLAEAGVTIAQGPWDAPWGARVSVLFDPVGHTVWITTPRSG